MPTSWLPFIMARGEKTLPVASLPLMELSLLVKFPRALAYSSSVLACMFNYLSLSAYDDVVRADDTFYFRHLMPLTESFAFWNRGNYAIRISADAKHDRSVQ